MTEVVHTQQSGWRSWFTSTGAESLPPPGPAVPSPI